MRGAGATALRLRAILESDRAWSAYALADLCPPWSSYSDWIAGRRSAVLIYRGLVPPVLFAHGDPGELDQLLLDVPTGDYWFTLRPTDFARLAERLQVRERTRMWRMRLPASAAGRPASHEGARAPADMPMNRLGPEDVPAILELFAALPEAPDAFRAEQLETGVFFGIGGRNGLLSVAGTHVISPELRVAALGNVSTRPEHRGRGLARMASQAVIAELVRQQFETIVLNVRMDNQPAILLYRGLGFVPYCGFYEGRGRL